MWFFDILYGDGYIVRRSQVAHFFTTDIFCVWFWDLIFIRGISFLFKIHSYVRPFHRRLLTNVKQWLWSRELSTIYLAQHNKLEVSPHTPEVSRCGFDLSFYQFIIYAFTMIWNFTHIIPQILCEIGLFNPNIFALVLKTYVVEWPTSPIWMVSSYSICYESIVLF